MLKVTADLAASLDGSAAGSRSAIGVTHLIYGVSERWTPLKG